MRRALVFSIVSHTAIPTSESSPPLDLDTIYRQYGHVVARWAARLGGPQLSVEDVVHDVFLVVSRRLHDFRGEGKISTWLFTITQQTIRNWRRRQRWLRLAHLTSRIEETTRSMQPTPVELFESREATAQFYDVLERLSEKHRNVLVLFELEGLSTPEIAELLNIKTVTVRVRLHRARSEFGRRLEAMQPARTAR